jgi:NAD(P) transhydrogenase subunit alpha
MAVTNALSSIIVVGAMIQTVGMPAIGVDANVAFQSVNVVSILGAVAVFLASINIFGGFAVTARMLEMFKPKQKKKRANNGIYSRLCGLVLPDWCCPLYLNFTWFVWP